jgi:hypothetical protein
VKWFEDNPLGAVLVGVSVVLLLLAIVIGYAWSRPVGNLADPDAALAQAAPEASGGDWRLGPVRDYQVINDRPLFNESRRPEVIDVDEGEEAEPEEPVVKEEPAEPPKVRLTGVVITPERRYVSLTPEEGGESLILAPGMPLAGEGLARWSVDRIEAREVRLKARGGATVALELAVFDEVIREPPPEQRRREPADEDQAEPAGDGEELSRAEQIRQRIQERREQLRAEADQEAEQEQGRQQNREDAYRSAIQDLIRRSAGADNKDEEG